MESRFKFRYVNEVTGGFVLVVVGLVIAAVLFTGRSQHWFSRKVVFDVNLPEQGAFGLKQGNEVFILGIPAGVVDNIRVAESGRITAHVVVRGDFARFLRADSQAVIKKVFGVAGDSYLEITRGSIHQPALPDKGATIDCQSMDELPDRVQKMLDELEGEIRNTVRNAGTAMTNWGLLGQELRGTQSDLRRLIARVDRVVVNLEQGRGTVGRLLTEDTLVQDLQSMATRGNTLMDELQQLTRHLRKGTARLPELGDALADEAQDLPGLVLQAQQTLREMERFVSGLEKHWLVRKYMDTDSPSPRIPPSEVEGGKP